MHTFECSIDHYLRYSLINKIIITEYTSFEYFDSKKDKINI